MLKGLRTTVDYDGFLRAGLCEEHQKELEVKDEAQSIELQRKALLYVRLQIFTPLLFDKPFSSEKIKAMFAKSKCFQDRETKGKEFKKAIMVLDSVVVYTLCYFGKICCAGAFYKTNVSPSASNDEQKFIHELLSKRNLEGKDINRFSPHLQENFIHFDENLMKVSYCSTLLFVRNTTMNMKLKQAVARLEADMQNVLKDGEIWKNIGDDAYKQTLYEEAIDAYTAALNYNPYNVSLLNKRAQVYLKLKRYEESMLDYYVVLILNPQSIKAYSKLAFSFLHQACFYESYLIAEYALEKFKDCELTHSKIYKSIKKILEEAEQNNKKELPEKSSLEISSDEEETEIPELIEASDSESEVQDVPDLVDASNSEESDSEEENQKDKTKEKSETGESATKTTKLESNFKEENPKDETKEESQTDESATTTTKLESNPKAEKLETLHSLLKEASLILLDGWSVLSAPHFYKALNEIKNFPEIYNYEECDIVCIKYAYGFALCKSKSHDDIQKAICIFKEIIDEHNKIKFPAAYYGMGLGYYKLNCFKKALSYLQIIQPAVLGENSSKVYNWPGLTTPINETNCEYLKTLICDLIKECENPPPPDAVCRLEKCSLRSSIYYTDPQFKGYYTVECSEHCFLQYHPQCWKTLRSSKHCTDKAFLEQKCFTPDCEGIIIMIQNICKEGNIEKTFVIADTKKLAKPKKSKLEKKLEIKEEKKRRRKDSTSRTESTSEVADEIPCDNAPENETDDNVKEVKNEASPPEVKEKEEISNDSVLSQLSANAEPFIVLKKEKFTDDHPNKVSTKLKEHRKGKNNTLSIDEFLQRRDAYFSEYEQRLNGLRENNESIIHNTWTGCHNRGENFHPAPFEVNYANHQAPMGGQVLPNQFVPAQVLQMPGKNDSSLTSSMYDASIDTIAIERVKSDIYAHMKDMLHKYGPLRIDAPILIDELTDFPAIANKVIADCDGIGGFLKQNMDFALVGDTYICLVTDVIAAYEKYNKECTAAPFEIGAEEILGSPLPSNGKDSDFFHQSHLNPDAKEYLPTNSSNQSSDDTDSKAQKITDSKARNSPHLLSAISKLRQPLTVDAEMNFNSDKTTKKIGGTPSPTFPKTKDNAGCLCSNPGSCSHGAKTEYSSPQEKVTEVLEKCTEAIKMYFSNEMHPHHSFIDECLKPFSIIEAPQKSSVCIQTENNEVRKESKGTMKEDEELKRMKEIVTALHVEKKSCLQKLKVAEEEHSSHLDSALQYQKDSENEIKSLKDELLDAKLSLEQQKEDFKREQSKWEEERQRLTDMLEKTEMARSNQKSEMDQIMADNESMKTKVKELEENIGALHTEKQLMGQSLELQVSKLKDCMKTLETENGAVLERAKYAERLLLCLKKTEFLRRIDTKTIEAAQRRKQLQEGISMVSTNLNPVFIENLKALLTQIEEYMIQLQNIRSNFIVQIDQQITKVNNGTPLRDMKPIDTTELPEIPSVTSSLPNPIAALNAQSPCWTSQVQKLNSAGNSVDPKSLLHPSASNGPLRTEIADSQLCQSNRQPLLPLPLGLPTAVTESDKSVLRPTVKLPPGIYNGIPAQFTPALLKSQVEVPKQSTNASASFAMDPQPSLKPQVGGFNQTQRKVNNITPIIPQLTGAKSKDSLATISSSTCATKIGKGDNPSSLELDYNLKKAEVKKGPMGAVSQESIEPERRNRFGKLLQKLSQKFPQYSQAQLMDFVKEIREKLGKLTGLSMEIIINEVGILIESKRKSEISGFDKAKSRLTHNAVLVNKKLVPEDGQLKDQAPEMPTQKKCPWAKSDTSKQWTGSNIDEECTICCEDMTNNAYKVDCGHCFHFKCIQQWLSKKSDCPICRLHLLLPDDYPALK